MMAYFNRFRTLKDGRGEAPKSKGAAAAIRQARINSSVVLGAMAIVMGALVADVFSGPFAHLDTARLASNAIAMRDVEPPPAADDVKIVSAQPKLDMPCEEQTWPYIDRRCLTESTKAPSKTPWRERQEQKKTAAADLDPRSAVPAVSPRPQSATDGLATRGSNDTKAEGRQPAQATPPAASDSTKSAQDAPAATTGSAATQQAAVAAPRPEQPLESQPEQTEAIVPLPMARPAIAHAAASPAEDPKPAPADVADDNRRPEAQAEKPRRRASRRHRDPGQRIVRRWRELIYEMPDGGSRRVLIFPRGMF